MLQKLTPAAAIVIVGVAALLGVLVYLKVPGAAVAAVGFATSIVALFTAGTKGAPGIGSQPPPAMSDPSEAETIPPPPPAPKA
jgi:hypothetical protein